MVLFECVVSYNSVSVSVKRSSRLHIHFLMENKYYMVHLLSTWLDDNDKTLRRMRCFVRFYNLLSNWLEDNDMERTVMKHYGG